MGKKNVAANESVTRKKVKQDHQEVTQVKPSVTEEKIAIDDLFAKAKTKKRKNEEAKKEKEKEEKERKKKDRVAAAEQNFQIINPDPKIQRYDQESGLPVYKYYDLKIGEPGSGFTPLCPFDCSCCF